jgi:hypothetical protein
MSDVVKGIGYNTIGGFERFRFNNGCTKLDSIYMYNCKPRQVVTKVYI